jgi:hypothetical protein
MGGDHFQNDAGGERKVVRQGDGVNAGSRSGQIMKRFKYKKCICFSHG